MPPSALFFLVLYFLLFVSQPIAKVPNKSFSIRMHSFDQKFAFVPISGNTQFQHTQMYKVIEIVIVFRIAHCALLVQNVDYQLLQCWQTCNYRWIINMSHTLVEKMWRRTELPTIESKECTCMWARKVCTCVVLRSWWVCLCEQIGSKSCCLDSVLHLHLAMGRNWSTVESSCEAQFWCLQEHMVEKPAVYS